MKPSQVRSFTLTELLVVVAIMGLLAALSIPAMQSMAGSGKFNQAVSGVAGLFELARSQAIAQNTYTWVVLWQNNPANNSPADSSSGNEIYAGAYLSNDGTDPFTNWTGTVTVAPSGIPTAPSGTTTTILPINRLLNFKQTALVINGSSTATLPQAVAPITYPGTAINFKTTIRAGNGNGASTASLSSSSTAYGVVEFTPSGAARMNSNMIESIWLGLYPLQGKSTVISNNVASLKVNGLTGLVTVYRR